MHFLRVMGVCVFVVAIFSIAVAKENKLGIHEVSNVTFDTPVRVGNAVLPAGSYVVRHTMEGEDHVMIFQREHEKDQIKVKCTLVALPRKAPRDEAAYQVNANNERVLQELVFSGDSSKHVF
ncbi:MAG: hypothetical protein ABSG34_09490 [Candidatus Sulfotelmatobacter sp.]|jgi:hypothetical protein